MHSLSRKQIDAAKSTATSDTEHGTESGKIVAKGHSTTTYKSIHCQKDKDRDAHF